MTRAHCWLLWADDCLPKPLLPRLVGAHSPLTLCLAWAQSLESVAEKFPNVKMPEAMQWLDTGEFLTEESFFRYRDETVESGEGGMVYVSTATILIVDYLFAVGS